MSLSKLSKFVLPLVAEVLGYSLQGHQHQYLGKPCQDAFSVQMGAINGENHLSIGITDGHGAAAHDRSGLGAEIACQCIHQVFQILIRDFFQQPPDTLSLSEFLTKQFSKRLVKTWHSQVMDNAHSKASTAKEASKTSWSRYGTTVQAVLVTQEFLFMAKLGDGEMCLIYPDSKIDIPLPNTRLPLNVTQSLSSKKAELACYSVKRHPNTRLLICTDGLSNSFLNRAAFEENALSTLQLIDTFGIRPVSQQLPTWLEHYSEHGSGDDISLVIIHLWPEEPFNQQDPVTDKGDSICP